jgi:hypothetical protein
MNRTEHAKQRKTLHARRAIAGAAILATGLLVGAVAPARGAFSPCDGIARLAYHSALSDAGADYWLAMAIANNLPTAAERWEASAEARRDFRSNVAAASEQYEARLDVCDELGGGRYHPEIEPEDFLTPEEAAANPNPWRPLVPGRTYIYRTETDEGTETVTVEVTHETRDILGVTCVVVHDTATLDGEVIEDTLDWYAQDEDGNVWYFGEQSLEYANGKVASMDGSWEAGEDGALPGILMPAAPAVGDVYRQEFALGEAEDLARVLSLEASETVPYGSFGDCLKTEDFTPLSPDAVEHKYFAPGIGEILAVNLETGEREELIGVITE